jgi:hypothetical protein
MSYRLWAMSYGPLAIGYWLATPRTKEAPPRQLETRTARE